MFTKIKINPNLQSLLKDFKQKVNNKSVNKDKENAHQNLHYIQTEIGGDNQKKSVKKVLNFTGNFKNHSISTSNKLTDYSNLNPKKEETNSKEKKLIDNPVNNIVQTEGNNTVLTKLNSFNKSNITNSTIERFSTLTSFFSGRTDTENKLSSPKLQKLLSSDKPVGINYKLIKQKLGNTTREKKDILFNKADAEFSIEDATKIKEKIFSFCKRNLFSIHEVTRNLCLDKFQPI